MAVYEIPLNPFPETFSVTLSGQTYDGATRWNAVLQTWVLSLMDQNGVPILMNVPLVPGVNLLDPYVYLNFGVQLQAQVDHDLASPPSYSNLGTTGHLFVVTP